MARQRVSVDLFYDGAWHAARTYNRDDIQIARGHGDEQSDPAPSSATLTLDNRTGAFNPRDPLSPLYESAGRNTPIRIRLLDPDQDVADTFGRAVSNHWGVADSGQPYTVLWAGGGSAADFDVASGEGTIVVGAANSYRLAYLPDVSIVDGDALLGPINLPALAGPTGASLEPAGVAFRMRDNVTYHLARIEWTTANGIVIKVYSPDGAELTNTTVFTVLSWTPGEDLMMRVEWEGETIRVRVWQADQSEPNTWNVEVTDTTYLGPGWVGVRSGIAAGSSDAPQTVGFGAFTVDAFHTRFVGEVASWRPRQSIDFDRATGRGDAWTEVTASGPLRRRRQGTPPQHSPVHRAVMSPEHSGLLAYWPLEDESTAQQAASAIPGQPSMVKAGTVAFARIEPAASFGFVEGTKALPWMSGGSLIGRIPLGTSSPVAWALQWLDGQSASDSSPLARWATQGGTHLWWELVDSSAGPSSQIVAYTATGSTVVVNVGTSFSGVSWRVDAVQNGANIDVRLWERGNLIGSGSVAGTLGRVTEVTLNPARRTMTESTDLGRNGHLSIWDTNEPDVHYHNGFPGISLLADRPFWSWWGEDTATRLARLCAEDGIPFTLRGDAADTVTAGAQLPATLAELLSLAERTDGGLLFESRTAPSLTYRTRVSRYNQLPVLELDYDARGVAPTPDPDLDDQGTRNDVTVRRTTGSTARAVQEDGPLSVQAPPDGVGRYETEREVDTNSDDVLADHAAWWLHVGTTDAARYPQVTVDLDAAPALAPAAGLVDIGDLITVDNLEPDLVELVVLRYVETINLYRRLIAFNCMPYAPWRVAEADGEPRVDTDGTERQGTAITDSQTFINFTTTNGEFWVTGDTTSNPTDFPIPCIMGGEQVSVTAIAAPVGNAQVFTVVRSVNGVVKAHPVGTKIHVLNPAYAAL